MLGIASKRYNLLDKKLVRQIFDHRPSYGQSKKSPKINQEMLPSD